MLRPVIATAYERPGVTSNVFGPVVTVVDELSVPGPVDSVPPCDGRGFSEGGVPDPVTSGPVAPEPLSKAIFSTPSKVSVDPSASVRTPETFPASSGVSAQPPPPSGAGPCRRSG